MGDIVTSASIKMAGDKFDTEILNYIKKQYKLLIGERTSENIKINIGTVFPGSPKKKWKFADVTWFQGFHARLRLHSEEIEASTS